MPELGGDGRINLDELAGYADVQEQPDKLRAVLDGTEEPAKPSSNREVMLDFGRRTLKDFDRPRRDSNPERST